MLLSTTEINNFSNDYANFFETMSSFHSVTVIKKPQEQITNINDSNGYFGYGESNSNANNVTYIPVSGVFRCMTVGGTKSKPDKPIEILPLWIVGSDRVIKLEREGKDFIENGQINERFILDGETYLKTSSSYRRVYGNNEYFYFGLNQTL